MRLNMAMFKIVTSGTFNLALSKPGYVRSLTVSAAGTGWTLQLNDGPNSAGNVTTLFGGTPATIASGMYLQSPLYYSQGFQVVTAGATPGEIEFDVV
jgi:hypothetical protein